MFPQIRQSQVPKPKKEKKCRIIIKKRKDGTVIKEVEGDCTDKQLKALSMQRDIDIDD